MPRACTRAMVSFPDRRRLPALQLLLAVVWATATLPRPGHATVDRSGEPTLLIGVPIPANAFERRGVLRAAFRASPCRGVTTTFIVESPAADPALHRLLRLEQEAFNDVLFPMHPGGGDGGSSSSLETARGFYHLAQSIPPPHPYPPQFTFVLLSDPDTFLHVPNIVSRLDKVPRRTAMVRLGGSGGGRGGEEGAGVDGDGAGAAGEEAAGDEWERAGALHLLSLDVAGTLAARDVLQEELRQRVQKRSAPPPSNAAYALSFYGSALAQSAWNDTGLVYDFAATQRRASEDALGPETLAVRKVETRESWGAIAAAFVMPSAARRVSTGLGRSALLRCTHLSHHRSVQPKGTLPFGEEEEEGPVPLHLPRPHRMGSLQEALHWAAGGRPGRGWGGEEAGT